MRFTIKVFGPQAQAVRCRDLSLELDQPTATCADLRRALAEAQPVLRSTLPASRFAVNNVFAHDGQAIAATDEIALIGLVSGG
jgi:molybdopterin converting factor small subunit